MTSWAIKNKYVTIVFVIILILAGFYGFSKIPQTENPGYTIRTALIITVLPGASTERMEKLVTDKLEKAIQEIPELDYVKSESKTGYSTIYVNIKESYKEMRPIWDKLRRKIDGVKRDLPNGIYGPFINDEFGDIFGTIISITGNDYSYKELKNIADNLRDELLYIDEVAKAEIYGDQKEQIFIEFDNSKLAKLGIPPFYIKQLIDIQNIIIPGGNIILDDKETIILEPTGNFESVEEIENIIIRLPEKDKVYYLKDLASVSRGYTDPQKQSVKFNGENSLVIAVSMKDDGNIINLGKKVKDLLSKLENKYPYGIDLDFAYFQADAVTTAVDTFLKNLKEAVIIVIIILLLSLGLKIGFLVAAMIPIVIVITFLGMYVFGIGIDIVSLGSLLIALGILVDTSIVVSESIIVHISHGKSVFDAAVSSAKELYKPLLVSILSISCAFLPIYLAESAVGEYTSAIFKVVAMSLLISWAISLTVIPLLCVMFLKTKTHSHDMYGNKFYSLYKKFLLLLLKNKIISFIVIISIFSTAIYYSKYVPKVFFPPSDRSILTLQVDMPPSTPLKRTTYVSKKIDEFIKNELKTNESRKEGIIKWSTYIGQSAPRYVLVYAPKPPSEEYSYFLMEATSNKILDDLKVKIEKYCSENFPEITVIVKPIPNGIPLDYPIEIRAEGHDINKLYSVVEQVKTKLKTIKGVDFVTDDWGMPLKKLVVKVDQVKAYYAGITNQDVAISLQTVLSGIDVSSYRENENIIPITLRSVQSDRNDIEKLENLEIYSLSSRTAVMLKQIAQIDVIIEPSKIIRRDRFRTITVQAALLKGFLASDVSKEMKQFIENINNTNDEIKLELGGEAYESDKSNKSIGDKLPIAGLIIILLLVLQYNSIKKPVILFLTVPLGFIGVVIGLLITGVPFGFMTLLGIVSLAGIIINNSNVLMDRIRIEIEENNIEPAEAIIISAQKRLRPILLTTIATVSGLIPLWLSGGPLWQSMAIALIFGLIFATMLTLGVLPLLYATFHGIKYKNYVYKK